MPAYSSSGIWSLVAMTSSTSIVSSSPTFFFLLTVRWSFVRSVDLFAQISPGWLPLILSPGAKVAAERRPVSRTKKCGNGNGIWIELGGWVKRLASRRPQLCGLCRWKGYMRERGGNFAEMEIITQVYSSCWTHLKIEGIFFNKYFHSYICCNPCLGRKTGERINVEKCKVLANT